MMRRSVATTAAVNKSLAEHLLRADGQEDLCFMTWRPSTGATRKTSIVQGPILPREGERVVHGNASFLPEYVLRAAQEAGQAGLGLAFAHSHPGGRGWQRLNPTDQAAEARIANIAREVTGHDLIGMTLGGDGSWSARAWDGAGAAVEPRPCESVRVVGDGLGVTFNDDLIPVPETSTTQIRTVHAWGERTQADLARLHVVVAGVGSVGMLVLEALARTGVERITAIDFDSVEMLNLDRLRGAGLLDVVLRRSKVHVARRLATEASTARTPRHEFSELSICEPEGMARVLDADIVFSCVDRPWPRHVLNTIAYADLIPVVEGGVRAFCNSDHSFKNAYWRSTTARPGRPCLACLRQYDPGDVPLERDGSLDDPTYIAGLPTDSLLRARENVAGLSMSSAAALVQQFLCHVTKPSGLGDPGPLKFSLRGGTVAKDEAICHPACHFAASVGVGDGRGDPTAAHNRAVEERQVRKLVPMSVRIGRWADEAITGSRRELLRVMRSHSMQAHEVRGASDWRETGSREHQTPSGVPPVSGATSPPTS